MFLDALSMRTRLLAILAGTVILGYLSVLGGFGGGITQRHIKEARPRLPVLPDATPERLSQIGDYADIAAHSLFSSDRRPKPFRLTAEVQPGQTDDLRLTGVLITPTIRMATLQTTSGASLRLRLDHVTTDGWRLLSIEPRAAVVEGPGGARSLQLHTSGQDQEGRTMVTAMAADASMTPLAAGQHLPIAVQNARAAEASSSGGTEQLSVGARHQVSNEWIRRQIEARRQKLVPQAQANTPTPNP